MNVSGGGIAEILYMIDDGDGKMLESMSWPSIEAMSYSTQDGDSGGRPAFWAKWGSRLRIYPEPDAVYTIGTFARMVPTELSADSDTPLIPLAYRHSVLVNGAAADLLRQEGGGEAHSEAVYYEREYDKAIINMRTAHATARKPTFRLKSPNWDEDHSSLTRGDWTR